MDVKNYENIRNLTILFFLEKLLDRGESRSLHDLSCQFGTKGFSKEMRQIAGGSKAGLRRFLSQYPSLFTIQDDQVYVSQVPSTTSSTMENSCNKGGDSNDNTRDYEHEAMLYFKNKLKQYGEGIEVPIKSLLGHRSQAPPEVRHFSGQHIKEFREFLLKFDQDFVVTEETIYLKEYEGTLIQMYSETKKDKSSDDFDSKSSLSSLPLSLNTPPIDEEVEAVKASRNLMNEELVNCIKSLLENTDQMNLNSILKSVMERFESRSEQLPFTSELNLRAFLRMHPSYFLVHGSNVSLIKSSSSSPAFSPSKQQPPQTNVSLKDRVNSVLKKAMAENLQRDGGSPTGNSISPTTTTNRASPNSQEHPLILVPRPKMDRSTIFVKKQEVKDFLKAILNAAASSTNPKIYGLEIKGSNIGPEGNITSIHIGTPEGYVYIFDMTYLPNSLYEESFKAFFESNYIVKVVHDCRNDSSNLWFQHKIQLCNVFDTQAAYAVLQHQENVSQVHKVKNLSLSALCKVYNISSHEMMESLKSSTKRDPKFWTRRPFENDVISLAMIEVITLASSLYPKLKKCLKEESLPLFQGLCEEQVKLHIEPDLVKSRKNQRKIELEIADIKQKLSSSNGKHVVLSNREIRLLRFIDLTDDDIKKIKGTAKVAKKLERLTNPQDAEDLDSNPPSLESVSSESDNNNSSRSPSSLGIDSINQVEGLERIEKLEALIANMTEIGNHSDTDGLLDSNDILITELQNPPNLHPLNSKLNGDHELPIRTYQDAETQTLSTGDIEITKVYPSDQ